MFHFLSKNSFSYGHNPTLPSHIQLAVDQQDHMQLVSKITDFSFDICKFFAVMIFCFYLQITDC